MVKEISTGVHTSRALSRYRHPTSDAIIDFRGRVLAHYRDHARDLPWRKTGDPYKILVSEIMLQQTQVSRVMGKWERFVDTFPDFTRLAAAPLIDVLTVWRGLGYNRRALYLMETARVVVLQYGGRLPDSPDDLVKLPGIGPNTAGAIAAFVFNLPSVFIETNIRSAFIHHFFTERDRVRDAEILPLIEAALDRDNPRIWYWALMDYGAMIKEITENPSRRSARHTRQSPFSGSNREIRGAILKLLVAANRETGRGEMTEAEIISALPMEPGRIHTSLTRLIEEGFIVRERGRCRIP